MKKILLITGMAFGFSFGAAHAQVIYKDTFNRTATLDGSYPTVDNAPGDPAWSETDGSNGSSSQPITTDGTLTTPGSAVFANGYDGSTATLALTLAANTDYYAQVTLEVDSGSTSYWAAAGFTAGTLPPANGTFNANSPFLWSLDRDTGGTATFSPSNNTSSDDGSVSGADTLTFLLNTGSRAFSITDSQGVIDYTGTLSSSDISSITGFSIGDNAGGGGLSGDYSDLEIGTGPLPTTPEPSAAALMLLGFFGLAVLLRLRKGGATLS